MLKGNELKHLAIIMDGNGRWAKQHNKLRFKGHEQGAKNVREITEYVSKSNIKFLTLYAFSTENWNRPKTEVNALMRLIVKYLKKEKENYLKDDIKFEFIGDIEPFSSELKDELLKTKELTKNGTNLTQIIALNYGFKDEMIRAMKKIIEQNLPINEQSVDASLDTNFAPNVDLLIRTGKEQRLSNFLLWQSAYAELRFSDTLWPDFTCKELEDIILSYKNTHRRFGGL